MNCPCQIRQELSEDLKSGFATCPAEVRTHETSLEPVWCTEIRIVWLLPGVWPFEGEVKLFYSVKQMSINLFLHLHWSEKSIVWGVFQLLNSCLCHFYIVRIRAVTRLFKIIISIIFSFFVYRRNWQRLWQYLQDVWLTELCRVFHLPPTEASSSV